MSFTVSGVDSHTVRFLNDRNEPPPKRTPPPPTPPEKLTTPIPGLTEPIVVETPIPEPMAAVIESTPVAPTSGLGTATGASPTASILFVAIALEAFSGAFGAADLDRRGSRSKE